MIRKEAFYRHAFIKSCQGRFSVVSCIRKDLKCALQNTPKITIMETDIRKEVECI